MLKRFLLRGEPPESRVESQHRLAHEKSAQADRVIVASGGFPADAGIHDPAVFRPFDETVDYGIGQNDFNGFAIGVSEGRL